MPQEPTDTGTPLLSKFSSEKLLQQAIAALLLRLPDIERVQILQGPQEAGKDIIFYTRGAFREELLCACVVKNTRITGSAERSSGARTVYHQAEESFDTPHTTERGEERRVDRVYIITPFELANETINSIRGRLNEKNGQVVFIHGPHLFDLFRRYWPDYLSDEATVFAKKTDHPVDQAVKKLAFQYQLGAVDRDIRRVYVRPQFAREITAYSLGELWLDLLPSSETLLQPWSNQANKDCRSALRRYTDALSTLTDWGYTNGHISTQISAVKDFEIALGAAWDKSYADALHRRDSSDTLSGTTTSGEFSIANALPLIKLLTSIHKNHKSSLAGLDASLVVAQSFIKRNQRLTAKRALTSPEFRRCSVLKDLAEAMPVGYLSEMQSSCTVDFPEDLLDRWDGPLLIEAPAGYGKTSFCCWHALLDAEQFTARRSNTFPVYIRLHTYAQGPIDDFGRVLANRTPSALLSDEDRDRVSRFRIYLDGLDEIPSADRRKEIVERAQLEAKNGSIQIVITSRPYIKDSSLTWLLRVRLREFTNDQVNVLATNWLEERSITRRFHAELKGLPALSSLIRVPLLATLVILVFRQTGKLPESRTRLYEMFLDLLSGGWDLVKGVHRSNIFGAAMKLAVVRKAAYDCHLRERRDFTASEFRRSVASLFPRNVVGSVQALLNELVEDGILARAGDSIYFTHLSFQEFLAARYLLGDPSGSAAQRHLTDLLVYGKTWWKEVITHYIGLAGRPRDSLTWIRDVSQGREGPLYDELTRTLENMFPTVRN